MSVFVCARNILYFSRIFDCVSNARHPSQKLQHHYAHHAMLGEQQEYVREGLEWSSLSFTDNKACVELIESKPTGLLSLLDEGKDGRGHVCVWMMCVYVCVSACV